MFTLVTKSLEIHICKTSERHNQLSSSKIMNEQKRLCSKFADPDQRQGDCV